VWTSTDPDEEYWDSYSYVGGNPVNLIDDYGFATSRPIPHPPQPQGKPPTTKTPPPSNQNGETSSSGTGTDAMGRPEENYQNVNAYIYNPFSPEELEYYASQVNYDNELWAYSGGVDAATGGIILPFRDADATDVATATELLTLIFILDPEPVSKIILGVTDGLIIGASIGAGIYLYKEHTKGARKSTEGKHQKGQRRKGKDKGGEKADARRPGWR